MSRLRNANLLVWPTQRIKAVTKEAGQTDSFPLLCSSNRIRRPTQLTVEALRLDRFPKATEELKQEQRLERKLAVEWDSEALANRVRTLFSLKLRPQMSEHGFER